MCNKWAKELDSLFYDKKFDKEYTIDDYRMLQNNLIQYKVYKSKEAAEYIIKAFHKILRKYVRFIKEGDTTYSKYTNGKETLSCIDPSLRKFVPLFINKKKETDNRSKEFAIGCVKIFNMFKSYSHYDIYDELVVALLSLASRYKITKEGDKYHKENGTFHMYVLKCFHFEAYNVLSKLIKDPSFHCHTVEIHDDYYKDKDNHVVFLKDNTVQKTFYDTIENVNREYAITHSSLLSMIETCNVSIYDDESINFNWTNGITCCEIFQSLSSYERELLSLSYVQNKTDQEIGNIYGTCNITIGRHRKKIIEKIKPLALKLNIIKEEKS